MAACPNKSSQEWKDLVNALGSESEAMTAFIQNNNEIPSLDQIGTLDGQYTDLATEGTLARSQTIEALESANNRFETRRYPNDSLPKGYYRDEGEFTDLYYDKQENRIVKNRVTHAQSKKFRQSAGNQNATALDKKNWQFAADTGTLLHEALENLFLGNFVDASKVPHLAKLRKRVKEIQDIAQETQNSIDPTKNYIIRVEQKVNDPNSDTTGSVDVLVIYSDNTASTFDHKFTPVKKELADQAFPWPKSKFQSWDSQASDYKKFLMNNYGIRDVRHSMVMPYNITYKKNAKGEYTGVRDIDVDRISVAPVPLANQMTQNKNVNNLLERLFAMRDDLMNQSTWNDDAKAARLKRLNSEIQAMQLTSDVTGLTNEIIATTNEINSKIENGDMAKADILEAINITRAYKSMYADIKEVLKGKDLEKARKVLLETSDTEQALESLLAEQVARIAEETGVEGIQEAQVELGFFEKVFRGLSQVNHPIFQSFYRLIRKANNDTLRKVNGLRSDIQEAISGLQKYTGKTGVDMYSDLLEFRDGKWTGNLANIYSREFWDNKNKAIENQDVDWLAKNLEFDSKKYEEAKEKKFQILESAYGRKEDAEFLKNLKNDWVNLHDVRKSKTALLNKNNYFVKGTEANFSEKYQKIQSTPALKTFYDLFTGTTMSFKDVFPQEQAKKLKSNFVPNIKNGMLQQIADSGLASATELGESLLRSIEVREGDDMLGMIDPNTGEVRKTIPILYMEQDQKNKSMDLGRSLLLFADMAYNYDHMSRIEHDVLALREVLSQQSEITTDAQGQPIRDSLTGRLMKTFTGSRDNLGNFEQQLNYQVYGQSLQGRGLGKSEIFGTTVSWDKILKKGMSHLSMKALAFNPISIVANSVGASANAYFMGLKGQVYNRSDWANASKKMGSRDSKMLAMVHYFDFEGHNSTKYKADRLSVSALTRTVNKENAFLGQRWGESLADITAAGAMFESHTLDNGMIRKRKEGEKSLYDYAQIKDDQLVIEGLEEEGWDKFRAKIQTVSGSIKGTASAEDMIMARTNIMGQVLFHFRSWMPRMIDERFGELRYNQTLEDFEVGRYRAFFGTFAKENMLPLIKALSKEILSFSHNTTDPVIQQRLESKYSDYITNNPESKISKDQFVEMYYGQIRAMSAELKSYLAFFSLILAPRFDDEPEKNKGLKKYAYKMLNKSYDEIAFFMSPASALAIIKSPFPLFGQLTSLQSLLGEMIEAPYDYATKGETDTNLTGSIAKQIPLSSQVVNILEALTEE